MMNIKKYLNVLLVLALAVAGTMIFASCGDNDEPDAPEEKKEITAAEFTTSLCVNKTMLDLYDIVGKTASGKELKFSTTREDIAFITPDGKTSLPMYVMKVDAKGNSVPLTSIMEVTFTLKEGCEVPEKNEIIVAIDAIGTITYSNGSSIRCTNNDFRWYNSGIMGSHIEAFTTKLNQACGYIKATLTEKGISVNRTQASE